MAGRALAIGTLPDATRRAAAVRPGSPRLAIFGRHHPGDDRAVATSLQRRVGWQPSRFLADRAEAEHTFALAERLGSVIAAAVELGTTWPSLRNAFRRHGLGMPASNPEAIRQRAINAARQRTGRPATPSLDPVLVALNHGELPVRSWSGGELAEGSAVPRTSRCLARDWWWNFTLKATPPSPARGRG
jgi:hypothetical protein